MHTKKVEFTIENSFFGRYSMLRLTYICNLKFKMDLKNKSLFQRMISALVTCSGLLCKAVYFCYSRGVLPPREDKNKCYLKFTLVKWKNEQLF